MRTTLTLDDDVAALLERFRREHKLGLKEAVNEAMRRGLTELASPPRSRRRYRTPAVDGGRAKLANVDCVADALAFAEGEGFR